MPKYYQYKVAGSAKLFVKENGDSVLMDRGVLTDQELRKIQEFIKERYKEMYRKCSEYSSTDYYRGE